MLRTLFLYTFITIIGLVSMGSRLAFAENIAPYTCRNGLFPSEAMSAELYQVNQNNNEKLYFFDDAKGCPSDEARCKLKSYVVRGNELIINKIQDGWACAWYQGKKHETVGWVRTDKLKKLNLAPSKTNDWTGAWETTVGSIKIEKTRTPALRVKGFTTWGSGPSTNTGELEGLIKPYEGQAMLKDADDEYACIANFSLIGRYLIVSDNGNCGGLNVRFDDVYLRK